MSTVQSVMRYQFNCNYRAINVLNIASKQSFNHTQARYIWSNLHTYNISTHRTVKSRLTYHNVYSVRLLHRTTHRFTEQQSTHTSRQESIPNNRRRIQLNEDLKAKNRRTTQYSIAFIIFCIGMGYAAVPLYRAFCRVTGFGGTVQETTLEQYEKSRLKPGTRDVTISFTADVGGGMPWEFYPTQQQITLRIGEPALAFFTAKNKMKTPITGVATYNVTPMKAGLYFRKIQCFCFDEQRLKPDEEVDMPVFFYIDPEMEQDKRMRDVTNIVLSYTFWPMECEDEASQAEMDAALARSMELREAEIEQEEKQKEQGKNTLLT